MAQSYTLKLFKVCTRIVYRVICIIKVELQLNLYTVERKRQRSAKLEGQAIRHILVARNSLAFRFPLLIMQSTSYLYIIKLNLKPFREL